MVIKPLGSNLLLKQDKEVDKKTNFGFIVTGSGKEIPQAMVVAIGDEVTKIQVGERVLLKSWGGEDVTIGSEKYKVLPQEEILGIIEQETTASSDINVYASNL